MMTVSTTPSIDGNDPRIQAALAELRELILTHFPDATFTVTRGEDPEGIYLTPTVDVDDLSDVIDVFIERLVDFQVDEGLPINVVPDQPLERVIALLRKKEQSPERAEDRLPALIGALGLSDAEEPLA